MNKSDTKVKGGFVALFEKQHLCDVSIIAQGKEIKCHKAILCSQSEWLSEQLSPGGPYAESSQLQLNYKYKVVLCLVRMMYFGGLEQADLAPEEALDLLMLAEELKVAALDEEDVAHHLKEPSLTPQNSMAALKHDVLPRYPMVQEEVCHFVGRHFLSMLKSRDGEQQLLEIPRHLLAGVLKAACNFVSSDTDTALVVDFCRKHTELESTCDLLRETKQWQWGAQEVSVLREVEPREGLSHVEESREWRVENVRAAMDSTPGRIVQGAFFDWCIRLDYGAEGRLRIVYESATPREDAPRCINRFPAAMFAWNVVYRGQDVFNEKPVFICFPENVSLHWSTTLPISVADLTDSDDLRIMVSMAENPMLSLILYHFSADIGTVVQTEDILNRLPHIEYRCLSSYSLVKTHVNP